MADYLDNVETQLAQLTARGVDRSSGPTAGPRAAAPRRPPIPRTPAAPAPAAACAAGPAGRRALTVAATARRWWSFRRSWSR